MDVRKFEIISCPRCGREYLPAEIFIPGAFFGHPHHIERDFDGKLICYKGSSVNLKETYVCDACNTEFNVNARFFLSTEETKIGNIEEESFTPFVRKTLFVDEGE